MFKKILLITMTLFITISFAGTAWAVDKGNKRKGKYTYRKVYKACFERGEVEVAKPKVNPDAYSQAEWTQIFSEKSFEFFIAWVLSTQSAYQFLKSILGNPLAYCYSVYSHLDPHWIYLG